MPDHDMTDTFQDSVDDAVGGGLQDGGEDDQKDDDQKDDSGEDK